MGANCQANLKKKWKERVSTLKLKDFYLIKLFKPYRFFTALCLLPLCIGLFLFVFFSRVEAESLSARFETAAEGGNLIGALHLTLPQGFHAYAHEPGDAGRPTTLQFSVGGGAPLAVWYPEGAVQRDFYDPSATIFVYESEVTLYVLLPAADAGKPYIADISMLLCSTRNCMPVNQQIQGVVPRADLPLADVHWAARWRDLKKKPPQFLDGGPAQALPAFGAGSSLASGSDQASQEGQGSMGAGGKSEGIARWLAAQNGEAAQNGGADPASHKKVEAENGQKALPPPDGFVSLTPRYVDESLEISGLGKALLFGILAGLLLNAMPCVLPVLTFKVSGLLMVGGYDKKGLKNFRRHNICFAAGVMTLFSALALVLGLADLMWGQLYQSQPVLLVMLLLVFLMGLSMLGVFTLPIIDLKAGTNTKNPCLQAYFTGLVSTFLATPCSGPLLGGVLGWAFTQPLMVVVVVFWAVGLGMALPYILFSIWPVLARILPKPGPWMHVFERIVGFFLLGTALYLLSILPVEKHMQVLSVLLVVALCAWLWGKFCDISAPPLRRRLVGLVSLGLLLASVIWVLRPVAPLPQWRDFNPQTFEATLGHKPMLLEFTADWCPNCKFMEATVLTDERLRRLQARYGMELVRVDLTNANAYAVRLLEALGSKSIPLTALFPAGSDATAPLVLRDVYSSETLERALGEAFGK